MIRVDHEGLALPRALTPRLKSASTLPDCSATSPVQRSSRAPVRRSETGSVRPEPSGSQTRARMSALAQWRYASSTVTWRTRIGSLLRTASGARYSRSVTISNAPVDPQGLVQARHEEHQPHAGALHQVRQRVQLAVSRPIGEQQRPVVQDVGQRSGQVSPRRGVGPPVGPRRADHAERRQGQEVAAVHVQMVQHLEPGPRAGEDGRRHGASPRCRWPFVSPLEGARRLFSKILRTVRAPLECSGAFATSSRTGGDRTCHSASSPSQ